MHAIVETGGKQYKVAVGETLDVEKLDVQVGDSVSLDKVLMVFGDDSAQVGNPIVEGAHVAATVVEHGKGKKVVIFKYRPKQRYRLKKGHRQQYTRLHIDAIEA